MKLKKILLQLGLLLAFVGVGMVGVKTAEAAGNNPSGVDADASLLSGASFDNKRDSPNFVDDITEDGTYGLMHYPEMPLGVYANGVVNGRVTNQTTKFFLHYVQSSSNSNPELISGSFTGFYPDIMQTAGGHSTSLVTNSVTSWPISGARVTRIPTGWTELDVNLTKLGQGLPLPIYIGFTTAYGTNLYNRYYWVSLGSDPDEVTAMGDLTIDGGGTVSSSASKITGTGKPGLTVSLSSVSGTHTATVQDDGKYTIDLGSETLNSLKAGKQITVTEFSGNEFGDAKEATAKVVPTVPLTITPATANLTVSPDDWDANIKGKSSSDIATWLAKQTNLVVTKQNLSTVLTASGDGLAFDTASDLSTLTAGDTQAVQVTASDTAGDKSTDPATINVTRGLGNIQFTTISDMVFGNGATLAVPSTQTLYAPGNYNVNVSDSRATGSPWYLTAKASTLTDGDGGHTFSGHVVYADGKGSVVPLDAGNAVQVGSGTRSNSTYDLASSWNQKGNSYTGSSAPAGVYLQANPNVYSGSSSTTYNGTMTWYLSDTPKVN